MSAADDPKRTDQTRPIKVTIVATGETKTLPYRQAVGLLSLGRAELAKSAPKKPKATKAEDVSTTTGKSGQDRAQAGNKPPSGADSGGRS